MLKICKRLALSVAFAFLILLGAGTLAKTDVHATAVLSYWGVGGSVRGVPGRTPGEQWFYFTVSGGGANMGNEAFCRNPRRGAGHGIAVSVSKSTGPSYALKALTWYFRYHHNDAGRKACQAFIWAHGKKSDMANGYEKYWSSIAGTTGVGYVLSYTAKSGKLQGWYGYQYVPPVPKFSSVHYDAKVSKELEFKLKVVKREAGTGVLLNKSAFKINFDDKRIGKTENKTRIKETKDGWLVVSHKEPFKKKIKSGSFKYCTNWNILEQDTKKQIAKSCYHDKASAVTAAKASFKKNKEAYLAKIKEGKHRWEIEEVRAPIAHFLLKGRKQIIKASKNDGQQTSTFYNQTSTYTIKVQKSATQAELKIPLSGAKFALYANGEVSTSDTTKWVIGGKKVVKGTQLATGTTDANGALTFATKLYPGSYYIKELSPPAGYLPNTNIHYFTLAQQRTSEPKALEYTAKISEPNISGRISITKLKGFSKEPEQNIKFKITANQTTTFGGKTYQIGDEVQTLTTDSDGKATSKLLAKGSYTVTQLNTSADSVKVKPWTVNIDGVTNKTFSYTKQDLQLKIKKYVEKQGEKSKPEKGAVFQVIKASDESVVGTITTDDDGIGIYTTKTSGNKELEYGEKYTLHQTEGEKGVSFAEDATFTLNDAVNSREYAYSFVDTNSCILLKYKVDAITGEKTPEAGAEFEISEIIPDDENSNTTKASVKSQSTTKTLKAQNVSSTQAAGTSADDKAPEVTTTEKDKTDTPAEGTTEDAPEATTKAKEATEPAKGENPDPDWGYEPEPFVVSTNEAGVISLAELDFGEGKYRIHQISGDENYFYTDDIIIRVDEDGLIYEGDEQKNTLSITRYDYSKKNALTIKKTMSDYDGNKSEEAGAVFSILKTDMKKKDGTAVKDVSSTLAKLITTQLRQEFVSTLAKDSILGTVTTGDDGTGSLDLESDAGDFVILQTEGAPGYTLADPTFSTDTTKVKLTKTTKDGKDYKLYSFTANDAKESRSMVSVFKQKRDSEGATPTPEKDVVFQVIDVEIAKKYGLDPDDKNALNTLSKCKAFVAKLPSNATIGVLTTNDKGKSDTELQSASVSTKSTDGGDYKNDDLGNKLPEEETTEEEEADDEEDEEEFVEGEVTGDDGTDDDDSYNGGSPVDTDDDGITPDPSTSSEEKADPDADKGITYWNADAHPQGFVIIQTDGDARYKPISPLYSKKAVWQYPVSNPEGYGWMRKEEKTDDSGMKVTSYSFQAIDDLAKVKVQLTKRKRVAAGSKGDSLSPEANAKFALFSTDDNGNEVQVGNAFTSNSDGVATSEPIPIGNYTLKQISGEDGFESIDDQAVSITEEDIGTSGEIETIDLNKRLEGVCNFIDKETAVTFKVIKKSSEKGIKEHKGEQVALKGATFEIYKKSDFDLAKQSPKEGAEYVKMLYTNKNGEAGCSLDFGEYVLYEKSAPYGYLIDKAYQEFTLSDETTPIETVENQKIRRCTITFTDTPIYGEIHGFKHGEILTGFNKDTGTFIYTDQKVTDSKDFNEKTYTGIAGAKYALYAKEDVVNDNGEIIWKAGEKISEATSDENGKFYFTNPQKVDTMASERDFWCGTYYFKEVEVPYGYTLDQNTYDVIVSWNESEKNINVDDAALDPDGFEDSDDVHTVGKHILTFGEKLNPLIKNAKTITFTWKAIPDGVNATDVSVSENDNSKPAGDVWLWDDGKGNVTISSCENDAVIRMNAFSQGMFKDCTDLEAVYFDNINTSQLRDATEMFMNCSNLTELDLSSFNFVPVWYVDRMFSGCSKLGTVYSAGIKETDEENVQLIPYSISAIPLNTFCVAKETDESAKFKASDFQFTMKYIRSDGAESGGVFKILEGADAVKDSEIEGFVESGPWSKDMTSVKIKFKDGVIKGLGCGSIDVPIVVNGPEDNGDIKINNHPINTTPILEQRQVITIDTLKVDVDTKDTLKGATIGLYALCDIHNADGEIIVHKGDLIQTQESDPQFGGITFNDLPTDAYASERGIDMYEIREISPPPGYYLNENTSYKFKGNCEDQQHIEFKHTYVGDKGLVDEDGNKITSDESAVYYEDCGIFENKEKDKLTIQKIWDDNNNLAKNRPKAVTFNIYDRAFGGDLVETVTLTEVNDWTADVDFISKSQAAKMSDSDFKTRFIVEEKVPEHYDHSDTEDLVLDRVNGKPVIRAKNTGTNRISAEVKKIWKDNNNSAEKRPSSVRMQLYQDGKSMGPDYIKVLDESNDWHDGFYRLEQFDEKTLQEHEYTWKEIHEGNITGDKNTGYEDTYEIDEEVPTLTYVTNTLDTGVHVLKTWEDDDNAAGLRPDSVKVQLYRNGESMGENYQVTLSEDNNWFGTIDHLDFTDADGNPYTYTWKEMDADWMVKSDDPWQIGYKPSYDTVVYNDMDTTEIINTLQTQGSISVTKELDPDDVYFEHGNPTFTFHLTGTDWRGNDVDLEQTVEYTEDDVKNFSQASGKKISKEAVFNGVEMGTYTITESGSEDLYEFNKVSVEGDNVKVADDGKSVTVTLGRNATSGKFYSTGKATYYNTSYRGSIKIIKYENDDKSKPLKGVTFSITNQDGEEIGTATTDKDGEINFTNLKRGKYTLKETKTVSGHSLLSKPFTVSIPTTLTKQAVEDKKADVTKGKYYKKNDTYDFYDLTYTVVNNPTLNLPHTGFIDDLKTYLPILLAMFLIVGAEVFISVGGKKKKKVGKHDR